MSDPTCFHLSASSIAAFKACPTRFRLGYREGIRLEEDTDAQRVGTNWHAMHEVYQNSVATFEREAKADPDFDAKAGGAHESAHDFGVEQAIEHLNEAYSDKQLPTYKTMEEWEVERQILVTCFIGYLWYWEDDPVEPIASEVKFDLPLHAPRTGLPLPTREVLRVGKIDHVVLWQGMIGNVERKSTSRTISPESDYWDKAMKDTQVSMYALAFRDMAQNDLLPQEVLEHPSFDPNRFGNTLYDVWHKPTIKPAKLTQGDTAALIETGKYHDQDFQVEVSDGGEVARVQVDEVEAEVTMGKKGFAIRETPAMYAARLLSDIQERPEFYFQRREIARTDRDLKKFRVELFNIYQAQRMYDKTGCWFENEHQCRATFPCQYIPICYGPGADAVCDGETTPDGFKRIFADLTVLGEDLSEGE